MSNCSIGASAARPYPLLILHGLSYFSYDWIPVAKLVALDREVIALDMRGFGNSTWSPTRDYRLETLSLRYRPRSRRCRLGTGCLDWPFIRWARLPCRLSAEFHDVVAPRLPVTRLWHPEVAKIVNGPQLYCAAIHNLLISRDFIAV